MLASWSHEGVVFLDLLSSSHLITSSLFPYPGSTDAPCSRLGDPVPPSPKWRPHSQGLRTLPYRDPEQIRLLSVFYFVLEFTDLFEFLKICWWLSWRRISFSVNWVNAKWDSMLTVSMRSETPRQLSQCRMMKSS
jgi:hypothetical protein